jgi:excisionase family DNA binding protein
MNEEMLTVDDVARITRLSKYTIRAAIRDCELVATKLRGRFLVDPADLVEWVDSGRVHPDGTMVRGQVPIPRPVRPTPAGGARQAVRERRRAA